MQGLIAGLESGRGAAVATAASIASDITAAFKANLDIRSPSRVFRYFGEMIMRGLGLGLDEYGGLAISSTQRTADDIRNVMFSLTDDLARMNPTEMLQDLLGAMSDAERLRLGRAGSLPPAPPGYAYAEDYSLVPTSFYDRSAERASASRESAARREASAVVEEVRELRRTVERTAYEETPQRITNTKEVAREMSPAFVAGVLAGLRSDAFHSDLDERLARALRRIADEMGEVE